MFTPAHWLWVDPGDPARLGEEAYRLSLRYQYAFERSDKDYLFITHDDCRYVGDAVGLLMSAIEGHLAAGRIGQCWLCPAAIAGRCRSERYWDYRPDLAELRELYALTAGKPREKFRHFQIPDFDAEIKARPWPLPECRVNEWCMLVDLKKARAATMPWGPAVPLGAYWPGSAAYDMDLGCKWFRDVSHLGHRCRHVDISPVVVHATGHHTWFDEREYLRRELEAAVRLRKEYGLTAPASARLAALPGKLLRPAPGDAVRP